MTAQRHMVADCWKQVRCYEWADTYQCDRCQKKWTIAADSDFAFMDKSKMECPGCAEKRMIGEMRNENTSKL